MTQIGLWTSSTLALALSLLSHVSCFWFWFQWCNNDHQQFFGVQTFGVDLPA
ncbi:hypothetical protein F5878DRAFT_729665 [Lentinula raphanica]|uniref:Uncharacterized protein n=1 Tax=Lentinula raphanica TaxID=153919 RepID=A0AA38NVN2_9AGAR|nr:hypothetical protein F5878DRAFT_729665 [Lentinula raphanica]